MEYLAKSYPRETLGEHTNRLLLLLDDFYTNNPLIMDKKMYEKLKKAAEIHDLGKMTIVFQNILRQKLGEELLDREEYKDIFVPSCFFKYR